MATMAQGRWIWMASIGLRYGYFGGEPVARVHQPLMTSPWWTISADDDADFVRIFPHVAAAIEAAEAEHEGRGGGREEGLTLDEAKTLLAEAAHLLQEARPKGLDPGNNRRWGQRRKAIVNRTIEAGIY